MVWAFPGFSFILPLFSSEILVINFSLLSIKIKQDMTDVCQFHIKQDMGSVFRAFGFEGEGSWTSPPTTTPVSQLSSPYSLFYQLNSLPALGFIEECLKRDAARRYMLKGARFPCTPFVKTGPISSLSTTSEQIWVYTRWSAATTSFAFICLCLKLMHFAKGHLLATAG